MDIITGYLGEPHITADQDRDINIGIVGDGSYVMPTGQRLAAEISSNNEVRIRDGVIMHQGCAASIKKNTYDPVAIINGSQGMKRIDLIVARYERNVETGVETISLVALQGTPAEGSPETPDHTEGDIQSGDTVADMPLYKVQIDGLNITGLEKVFEEIESLRALNSKMLEYKISDESVLIGSGERADLTVSFEKSYVSPPTIIATPYTSTGGGVDIAVKNVTNTGFTANMKNGGASAAYFKVSYLALNTSK